MKLIHLALIFTVLVQEQKLLCEGFKGFEIHNLVFLAQINITCQNLATLAKSLDIVSTINTI